jgi:tRNA(fMet)-specific endonuclease VapC
MLYTLDTNAASPIINGNERVSARWREVKSQGHTVQLNAISFYQVRRRLELPRFKRKPRLFESLVGLTGILLLDLPALERAASVYQELRKLGTPLEDAGIFAGIALANQAVLVTRNAAYFTRVLGLTLEDWEAK